MHKILSLTLAFSIPTLAMENPFKSPGDFERSKPEQSRKRFDASAEQDAQHLTLQAGPEVRRAKIHHRTVKSLPTPKPEVVAHTLFLDRLDQLNTSLTEHYDRHVTFLSTVESLPQMEKYYKIYHFLVHLPRNVRVSLDQLETLGKAIPQTRTLYISAEQIDDCARTYTNNDISRFLSTIKPFFPNLCTIGLGRLSSTDAVQYNNHVRRIVWNLEFSWEPIQNF